MDKKLLVFQFTNKEALNVICYVVEAHRKWYSTKETNNIFWVFISASWVFHGFLQCKRFTTEQNTVKNTVKAPFMFFDIFNQTLFSPI